MSDQSGAQFIIPIATLILGAAITAAVNRNQAKSQLTLQLMNEWHSETMRSHRYIVESVFETDKKNEKKVRLNRYSAIKSMGENEHFWKRFEAIRKQDGQPSVSHKEALHSMSMVLHFIERFADLAETKWLDARLAKHALSGMISFYIREFLFGERPPISGPRLKPLMKKLVRLESRLNRWNLSIFICW